MSQGKTKKYIEQESELEVSKLVFQIEELEPPSELLNEKCVEDVLSFFQKESVEVHSELPNQMISFGYHSFIYGMYQAYSDHRPFVLSPDMIWTLILQGFSHHVNFNKNTAEDVFRGLSKQEVIVKIATDSPRLQDISWETVMSLFTDEIASYVGSDLINSMRSDFSTTGAVERVVSEVTIMDTMKAYFEYVLNICICGIPEVTLEGSMEDWVKVKEKMQIFRGYNLSWWIDQLDPVVDEFVSAYQESVDKTFWMNMFKIHSKEDYGNPKMIDGWIFKFFPYDVDGNRMPDSGSWNIDIESVEKVLPKEVFPVDMILRLFDGQRLLKEQKLSCWAGFVGLTQNHETFALRPKLAWFIMPRQDGVANTVNGEYKHMTDRNTPRCYKQLDAFPKELEEGAWSSIDLHFKKEVQLPEKAINAEYLCLYGKYSEDHLVKLKRLFKNKSIHIVVNDEWLLRGVEKTKFSLASRDYEYPSLLSLIKRQLGINKWEKLED